MKRIEVAVGVIRRGNKVLVGQRLVNDLYFQKWEFPGGKLDENESPEEALIRELKEELGIQVEACSPLISLEHDYPDRQVRLYVFEVLSFHGEPSGREGQAIQWVLPDECSNLDFLTANQPIVNATILPKKVLITDIRKYGLEASLESISMHSKENIIVQLREPVEASNSRLQALLDDIKRSLSSQSLVLLNGDPQVALNLGFDGVHLNSSRSLQYQNRSELENEWVGVSCHNEQEIELANHLADFSFISPVLVTESHPNGDVLGWESFSSLAKKSRVPTYALGGMDTSQIEKACQAGAQGIAGISSFH